ncbi:hypothetical protein QBC40DRAFT_195481 [Triangularia verruculosa]|uniref:NACHT domain-containing protein n=1 Tax=Triangularia verruculosa TaxID=2587418 RepID=A0AAN6XP86_9PEZI|nr:hypothetical protein QBC40DRAFT_195481 [Triangularia verruculosa]
MEPLSALSVAAAVVQFIDWGTQVLSQSREIYKSAEGKTMDEIEISQIAIDLKALSSSILETISNMKRARSRYSTTNSEMDTYEAAILKACQECQEIASEMLEAIQQTTVQTDTTDRDATRVLKCVVKAIIKIRGEDKVQDWRRKMTSAKEKLMTALMTSLWAKTSFGGYPQAPAAHQTDLVTILERIEKRSSIEQPRQHISEAPNEDFDPGQQAVINAIWSPNWLGKASPGCPADTDKETGTVQKYCSYIIDSLRFSSMHRRGESIPQAYKDTFSWVFEAPRRDDQDGELWSSFPEWLEDPSTNQIYWITGKPGAGKSTLMKYIMDNPALQGHLRRWSLKKPILFGTFHFWIAGDTMQKSREGLLRSLIHQILSQHTTLVPTVCPRRWATLQLFGISALSKMPKWELPELVEILKAIGTRTGDLFNLALLIDGLDEFDGDHDSLLELLQGLNVRPGIKICVSSRPWNIFQDQFGESPSLRVEKLTERDMKTFVDGEFERTKGYVELRQSNREEAERLTQEIISKAQGVFLWVTLVVRQLCIDLTEGSKLSDLRATTQKLPTELSGVYEVIWNQTSRYRQHASQLFQLHKTWSESPIGDISNHVEDFQLHVIYLADEGGENNIGHKIGTPGFCSNVRNIMRRRLASRTRGLLEITARGNVEYLHRTARDWILESKWAEILSTSGPTFEPWLPLTKTLSAYVVVLRRQPSQMLQNMVWHCLYCAAMARDCDENIRSLLNALKNLGTDALDLNLNYKSLGYEPPGHESRGRETWFLNFLKNESTNKRIKHLHLAALFAILPSVRNELTNGVEPGQKVKLLIFTVFGERRCDSLATFRYRSIRSENRPKWATSRAKLTCLLLESIKSDISEPWLCPEGSTHVRRELAELNERYSTEQGVSVWEQALALLDTIETGRQQRRVLDINMITLSTKSRVMNFFQKTKKGFRKLDGFV